MERQSLEPGASGGEQRGAGEDGDRGEGRAGGPGQLEGEAGQRGADRDIAAGDADAADRVDQPFDLDGTDVAEAGAGG